MAEILKALAVGALIGRILGQQAGGPSAAARYGLAI